MPKELYTISDLITTSGVFCDGDWIESKDQDPKGEVKLIQLADIGDGVFLNKSNKYMTMESAVRMKCTFLKPGDILLARMPEPIGRACIFPGSDKICVTVVDVAIIRPENDNVSNEWLTFKINSPEFRHSIIEYSTGTTRTRISRANLDKLKFNLPNYNQQVLTASILSKSQNLITARKKVTQLLDEIAESFFSKTFFSSKKSKGNPFTFDEIKEPGKGTFSNGPFGSDLLTSELTKSGIPVIYIRDLRNGFFDWRSNVFVTREKANSLPSCIALPNDILISKVGDPPGVAAIMSNQFTKAVITQDVIRLRVNTKIVLPEYVQFYLNSKYGRWLIENISVKGTRNRFSLNELKKTILNVPSLKRQKIFADFMIVINNLKSNASGSLNYLVDIDKTLSQLAFDGKLNYKTNQNDQNASFTLSAFEDKPELAKAAIDSFNNLLAKQYHQLPNYSDDQQINNKLKQLEQERNLTGVIPLDIDHLKYIIKKDFARPFRAEQLQSYLQNQNIEFSYDHFVNLLFDLLKGKKAFLKQQITEKYREPETEVTSLNNDRSDKQFLLELIPNYV